MKPYGIPKAVLFSGLLIAASPLSAFGYLMPIFDHDYVTWTPWGPVGIGDVRYHARYSKSPAVAGYYVTSYVYLGYHQFTLPGSAEKWLYVALGGALTVFGTPAFFLLARQRSR